MSAQDWMTSPVDWIHGQMPAVTSMGESSDPAWGQTTISGKELFLAGLTLSTVTQGVDSSACPEGQGS